MFLDRRTTKITIVDPDSFDYTHPPEGLARPARRRWQRLFRDFREQYDMPPDLA